MVLFQEEQKFNQWWLWAILLGSGAATLIGMWPLLVGGELWPPVLILGIYLAILIGFATVSLRTTIHPDRLSVGFPPFGAKVIRKEDISRAYVRTYSPLGEYGGWGYRMGRKGKAYNVSGDQGLQLELRNGERILIGTREPERLRMTIERWVN
ncbi:hypothetical protein [Lewinella sp. IMCC34183]|uniref:hypothetical protein n=1 Tax=Lewinella sp. IMCC34183 TaxID=2248762 RepID=UPI000E254D0C|nr:hypothetical protein [Lewinella sp. IMCC34183]